MNKIGHGRKRMMLKYRGLKQVRRIVQIYSGQEISMEKRIADALKNQIIKEAQAIRIEEKLSRLNKNKEFQNHRKYLNDKWAKLLCGPDAEEISINRLLVGNLVYGTWPSKYREKLRECAGDLDVFLNVYKIDGIHNGKPFVDIFEYGAWDYEDNAFREIFCLAIPVNITIARFRKIAEREFGNFRSSMSNMKVVKYLWGYEKKKWGESSGKRKYFMERNKRIIDEYIRLRKSGMKIYDALEQIYYQLDLEKEIKDLDSLKIIIKRNRKTIENEIAKQRPSSWVEGYRKAYLEK